MEQEPTQSNRKLTCEMYVVGLIDLLNQGKQLDGWGSLPQTADEQAEFREALEKTVGVVAYVRESFRRYVVAYTDQTKHRPSHPLLTDAQEAECRRLEDFKLGCQNFSDTVVLYSPLPIPGGAITVHGIYGILLGSAAVLIEAFAAGVPLRGGIEVGMAIDGLPGEIYGPVLWHAHHLERHVAQYPRVVVGETAMGLLRACLSPDRNTQADQLNQVMASQCLSLIAIDQDGTPYVDFLGDHVYQLDPDKQGHREQVEKGHEFVKREHERFMQAQDSKLGPRYALLRQYYESRIGRWTDSPASTS